MKLRVMVVDDEPLAVEHACALVGELPDVEIVDRCTNGPDAIAAIAAHPPDVLLLDVQMPEMDGFELLRRLGEPLPLVVFVTAHDEHALSAFEVHAVDYVLKPIVPERLRRAIDHAREQVAARSGAGATRRLLELIEAQGRPKTYLSRLMVRERNRTLFVDVATIDWIEASNNYVVVHAGRQNHVLRETLGTLESHLSPQDFFRVSRSALVRLDRVTEVEPGAAGDHTVILRDATRLPLTRSLRDLQDRLRFG